MSEMKPTRFLALTAFILALTSFSFGQVENPNEKSINAKKEPNASNPFKKWKEEAFDYIWRGIH